jgi:sortase A
MIKKRFIIIAGVILCVLGSLIIFFGLYSSFRRLPPDAAAPVFYFDIEKIYRESIPESKDSRQENRKDRQESSSGSSIKILKVMELEIPKIRLSEAVYEGISRRVLMSGPGHISGTSYPDRKSGNCCISAHRVTFGGPFRKLDRLVQGDEIIVRYKDQIYFYRVIWIKRVKPGDVWVLQHTEVPSLTLTTCDPPYSAKYRLVVRAFLFKVAKKD